MKVRIVLEVEDGKDVYRVQYKEEGRFWTKRSFNDFIDARECADELADKSVVVMWESEND